MAFRQQETRAQQASMNVVPLIDVLLVLLVIFMVTVPIASRALHIDLPQAGPSVDPEPPRLRVSIDAAGSLFHDAIPLPRAALQPLLALEAGREPQPVLEIDADLDADYALFVEVLATARNVGLEQIGFVGR